MLTGKCIHPEIMGQIALCGHGDKILIADGSYPLASKTGNAKKIYIGLTPGLPTVTDVLEALQSVANFEKAEVMDPADGTVPEIFGQFQAMLGQDVPMEKIGRYAFYEACCKEEVRMVISTGEQRTFANVLLTVGCA